MPGPHTSRAPGAADPGFFGHLAGLFSASAGYLQARLQLAGIEAKEAAIHWAIILALAVSAVAVLLIGYLFLWVAIAFGIAALVGMKYLWLCILGVAIVHFLVAGAAGWMAASRVQEPLFTATLDEFRKDQQWLTPHEKLP